MEKNPAYGQGMMGGIGKTDFRKHCEGLIAFLGSNSKCNTTRPVGLRCCYVEQLLYAHDCRRT